MYNCLVRLFSLYRERERERDACTPSPLWGWGSAFEKGPPPAQNVPSILYSLAAKDLGLFMFVLLFSILNVVRQPFCPRVCLFRFYFSRGRRAVRHLTSVMAEPVMCLSVFSEPACSVLCISCADFVYVIIP